MVKNNKGKAEPTPFDDPAVMAPAPAAIAALPPRPKVHFPGPAEFGLSEEDQAAEDALLLSYNEAELAWLMSTNRVRYKRYLEVSGQLINEEVLPPVVVDVPHASQTGEVLSCTMGNWENEPTYYAYQWFIDGTPAGTGGADYVIIPSDVGRTATCVVTASNDGGQTPAPPSNPVLVVAAGGALPGPVNDNAPLCYVSGATMMTTPGDWTPAPASYRYQWVVDSVPVPGATGPNYTYDIPTQGGLPVFVEVTAIGADGGETMVASNTETVPAAMADADSMAATERTSRRRGRADDKDEDE